MFCSCHPRPLAQLAVVDGVLRHVGGCGLPVECDFSYLSDDPDDVDAEGTPHAATQIHVDYVVCDRHLDIAINNVAGRYT